MSRSKKLYILLGILAVACAATFAVMQMEERKEQIKETGEIILELPSESVQSLSWDYNETSLAFHKEEVWLYDEDENFPVSEEKINELLEQFRAFGAAFIIEDVEDFRQYGLDDPVCTISLSTEDQNYEIKLGDYSKMDSQRYVSIGDGNVYLVKHDPLDEFNATIRNLIDHDEVPELDQVTGISFSGTENYSITYEEEGADTYREEDVYFTRQNGKNLPLDTDRVRDYLDYIGYLNLTDYVTYNATEEEVSTYGLDDPELTVAVNYTVAEDGQERSDAFVLHVSRDPEEKTSSEEQEDEEEEITAYARVGDSKIVYQISTAGYKTLMSCHCAGVRQKTGPARRQNTASALREDIFMGDYHTRPHSRAGTLNALKEQLYSLNMRMLLAMQNHDEKVQEEIRQQMAALQEEIDQMGLGGGYRQ